MEIVEVRPGQVRTFHPRMGRMGRRHADALDRLWPMYGVPVAQDPAPPIDLAQLFGRRAPVVLEIGSGMGECVAAMAQSDPDRGYLAVEVHTPGIASLLAVIEQRGLDNVRVAAGDALDLARHQLAPRSLDAIHAFFPDPWPKARHHRRRLIQPEHVALLAARLAPGGALRCATDWESYALQMSATLTGEPLLLNAYPGFAPRPAYRPETKFERRAIDAGRPVFDLIFHRRATAAAG
jgi:tRNA (guanine-N7-)-methyltransferase